MTKETILSFIETVADRLPTLEDIDNLYRPKRSGYVAIDGIWFKYRRQKFVLLIAFDPETFDPISVKLEIDETTAGYERLITAVVNKLGAIKIKGAYGDGDKGLIQARNHLLPSVPFQVCIVP